MDILYQDEYEVELLVIKDGYPAIIGDIVVIGEEMFYVKSRILFADENNMLIVLSQTPEKTNHKELENLGRFSEMNNAILKANKRIDESSNKNIQLTEKINSLKKTLDKLTKQKL